MQRVYLGKARENLARARQRGPRDMLTELETLHAAAAEIAREAGIKAVWKHWQRSEELVRAGLWDAARAIEHVRTMSR
jgi:hypothetical protein